MSEAGSERNANPVSSPWGAYGVEDGRTKHPHRPQGRAEVGAAGETHRKLPNARRPEEVTQPRHKRDAAPHSEAPGLNTLRVVSMSGVATHVSDLVTTCESASILVGGSAGDVTARTVQPAVELVDRKC